MKYLAINAALAVREGTPEEEALKAITINAAEIIGVDDRVGSLEVGKDADIVIFSGHPFDYRTMPARSRYLGFRCGAATRSPVRLRYPGCWLQRRE